MRDDDHSPSGQSICIQCANRRKLSLTKIKLDIARVITASHGVPNKFLVVAGGPLSSQLRDQSKLAAKEAGIMEYEAWSGEEFEERLRANSESLLKRFIDGVAFPDIPQDLRTFVGSFPPANDAEILSLIARLLDRPAFYTPFHQESSIPAFRQAIADTIEALNTGIHRLRDGTEIRRIPSRHDLASAERREKLRSIERSLSELRASYDDYLKRGEIKPCGCSQPECPVFMISTEAAQHMDRIRTSILDQFRRVYPPFRVVLGFR